ncbi:MAG TPA: hypothetical protein VGJ28_12480 [Micromonosporaceae bacterium]|jgi:hypothetical protein
MLPPVRVSYVVLEELADALDRIAMALSESASEAWEDAGAVPLPRSGFATTPATRARIDAALRRVDDLSGSVTDVAVAVRRVAAAYSGSDQRAARRQP